MTKLEKMSKDDIWNAVIQIISSNDYPTESKMLNELFIVFQYYSELESGGHESFFNWMQGDIEEVGVSDYLNDLIYILVKIGANECAVIMKKYGYEMWRFFKALEAGEMVEDSFYQVIEIADREYYSQDGKLERLLEEYFVKVYPQLINE